MDSTLLAVLGVMLGGGGLAGIVIALIQRQKPKRDRIVEAAERAEAGRVAAEKRETEAREEAEELRRREAVYVALSFEYERHTQVLDHELYKAGKTPPPMPQKIYDLKERLL